MRIIFVLYDFSRWLNIRLYDLIYNLGYCEACRKPHSACIAEAARMDRRGN